jgi:hypothetical protein
MKGVREMEKILRGPWTEQEMKKPVASRLTEEGYEVLALSLVEARQALQRVGSPFLASGDILPLHCKNALNALGELKETVSVASQSLQHVDSFAVMLSPSRYPLLSVLSTLEEQALQLITQLDTYRFACLNPSRHVRRQQREIGSQLEDISRQLAAIPELVKSLDEDVASQELRVIERVPEPVVPAATQQPLWTGEGTVPLT